MSDKAVLVASEITSASILNQEACAFQESINLKQTLNPRPFCYRNPQSRNPLNPFNPETPRPLNPQTPYPLNEPCTENGGKPGESQHAVHCYLQ